MGVVVSVSVSGTEGGGVGVHEVNWPILTDYTGSCVNSLGMPSLLWLTFTSSLSHKG